MDSEIRLHGNALIRLLHHAATYELPVSVTLSSRKWYVGYIAESPNLEPAEACFRLLPILSGYRDKEDLTTRRVIYYSRDVYARLEKERGRKPDISVFVITLALKDVQDARIFDESVYLDHFSPERADAANAG